MNVLALNCGSSSLKFALLGVEPGAPLDAARPLASGALERLGPAARLTFEREGQTERGEASIADHAQAVERVLGWLAAGGGRLEAVGHRVVHGGARFTAPTAVDDALLEAIEALEELAPLHNRPSLAGIRACRAVLPAAVPMVAVFDTAFHAATCATCSRARTTTPAPAWRWRSSATAHARTSAPISPCSRVPTPWSSPAASASTSPSCAGASPAVSSGAA
jgi:acetate kinase